jgi:hypothetical protein
MLERFVILEQNKYLEQKWENNNKNIIIIIILCSS